MIKIYSSVIFIASFMLISCSSGNITESSKKTQDIPEKQETQVENIDTGINAIPDKDISTTETGKQITISTSESTNSGLYNSGGVVFTGNLDTNRNVNTGEVTPDTIKPEVKFDASLGYSLSNIKSIKTLDELKLLNPSLVTSSGSDNPNFIEFQKNQVILSVYLAQIKNPEFIKLRQDEMDIYQGKEIWSTELKDLDQSFFELMKSNKERKDLSSSQIFQKRNELLQSFQKTEEYKEYIKNSQSKIKELEESMKKYYTTDILNLKESIENLRKNIYKQ